MENINIIIEKSSRKVNLFKSVIGNDGENLQEKLVFSFNDEFVDGTGRLELIKPDKEKSYIMLEKIDETYQIPVKSIITKGGRLTMQLVITQGTDSNAIPIFKSNKFYVVVNSSINFLIEEPDEYPQWIDVANTKLNEIDEAIQEASNLDIDVNKEDNVTTITLTDKEGQTKEVQILDGQDGEQGPQGIRGETGPAGADGQDATINGVNTINIEAGDNITVSQSGDTLTISGQAGGTADYSELTNKPSINNVELSGNKTTSDLGIVIPDVSNFITKDVDNLTNYYKKTETYTQAEINNKLSAVYKYKGTVATYQDLPSTDLTVGDVYNVEDTGDNYAWTGTVWDKLSGTVDLSNYVQKTDYASGNNAGVIKENANGFLVGNTGLPRANEYTYSNYQSASNNIFISKGTLENVLNARIGDIDTALDLINGESVGA